MFVQISSLQAIASITVSGARPGGWGGTIGGLSLPPFGNLLVKSYK